MELQEIKHIVKNLGKGDGKIEFYQDGILPELKMIVWVGHGAPVWSQRAGWTRGHDQEKAREEAEKILINKFLTDCVRYGLIHMRDTKPETKFNIVEKT